MVATDRGCDNSLGSNRIQITEIVCVKRRVGPQPNDAMADDATVNLQSVV